MNKINPSLTEIFPEAIGLFFVLKLFYQIFYPKYHLLYILLISLRTEPRKKEINKKNIYLDYLKNHKLRVKSPCTWPKKQHIANWFF